MKKIGFIKKIKPFFALGDFAPTISIIRLHGIIGHMGGMKKGLSLDSLDEVIQKAFSFNRLKAVMLDINSPGGSPVQSSLICKRIRYFADKKKIPVYSFATDVAASGGYWLACAGDEIYAEDASIIGSIGVISSGFGLHALIKKIGIERRVHTVGKAKSILDPFKEENAEDIIHLKKIQKSIHDSFIELVKHARKNKLKSSDDETFSGAFWTGRQAKDMGLIDDVRDMNTVLIEKFGENVDIRIVNPAKKLKPWKIFGRHKLQAGMLFEGILSSIEEQSYWDRFRL